MKFTIRAMACFIAVLIASFPAQPAFPQDASLFHFVATPGRYQVGLKVVEQYDYSRTFRRPTDNLGKTNQGERARPIQTLVWYPAESNRGTAKTMTVGDYGKLMATEVNFSKPAMSARANWWMAGMAPTLTMPLWAVRDAPVGPGRFPVIIYAPSLSSMSWENADFCEYLASHGYVVIASPSMGATTQAMTLDIPGINVQARDISFLISYARTLPDTDMSEVAVAGFSWGGISNLFAAARDNRISALIALDGTMRYYAGLVKSAGDVHPEEMTIPLLYFTQGEFTIEDQARYLSQNDGPSVLNAWTHGDLITVHMLGFVHEEFSSMFQRNEEIWRRIGLDKDQKADYGRDDGAPGYSWMSRYALQFADAYLKHDAAAMAYLKKSPADNGVPKHFMSVTYRPATGVPTSFDGFRSEIGRQGFDHITNVYEAMRKQKADFKLDEEDVHFWSKELLDEDHTSEAIALLKLLVQIVPDSADAYEELGDGYLKSGQKRLAMKNYQISIEKAPDNQSARKKLNDMGISTPQAK